MQFFSWSTSFLCLALCGVMSQTAVAGHFANPAAAKAAWQHAKTLGKKVPGVPQVCTVLTCNEGERKGTSGSGLLMDTRHVLTALHLVCKASEVRVAPPGEPCYVMKDTASPTAAAPLWRATLANNPHLRGVERVIGFASIQKGDLVQTGGVDVTFCKARQEYMDGYLASLCAAEPRGKDWLFSGSDLALLRLSDPIETVGGKAVQPLSDLLGGLQEDGLAGWCDLVCVDMRNRYRLLTPFSYAMNYDPKGGLEHAAVGRTLASPFALDLPHTIARRVDFGTPEADEAERRYRDLERRHGVRTFTCSAASSAGDAVGVVGAGAAAACATSAETARDFAYETHPIAPEERGYVRLVFDLDPTGFNPSGGLEAFHMPEGARKTFGKLTPGYSGAPLFGRRADGSWRILGFVSKQYDGDLPMLLGVDPSACKSYDTWPASVCCEAMRPGVVEALRAAAQDLDVQYGAAEATAGGAAAAAPAPVVEADEADDWLPTATGPSGAGKGKGKAKAGTSGGKKPGKGGKKKKGR